MILNRNIIPITSRLYLPHLLSLKSQIMPHLRFAFSKQSDLEKISKNIRDPENFVPNIERPRSPDGGIYSVERIMDRDEVSKQLKERLQSLRKRHELLRIELSKKINIPFSLCGINRKTYNESYSYMPERVMSYYRIHPTTITDYLLKIYKASLYAIIDQNQSFMKEYWEKGFKERVMQSLETAKEKNYTLKLTEEKKFVEEMKESCKIVDAVMIRGLSMDRSQNEVPGNYHNYAEDKEFGLVTYTPLYLTGDNEKFNNPETNKTIYQGYEKMVLRVLVLIKTPLRLAVPELPVPPELNTYEHIAIFENQMVAPPHLESRYKLQTLVEWLGKYRFGPWNLVDIDNFMRGNSLFRQHQKEEAEVEQIFRNTIIDKSYYCNIRDI